MNCPSLKYFTAGSHMRPAPKISTCGPPVDPLSFNFCTKDCFVFLLYIAWPLQYCLFRPSLAMTASLLTIPFSASSLSASTCSRQATIKRSKSHCPSQNGRPGTQFCSKTNSRVSRAPRKPRVPEGLGFLKSLDFWDFQSLVFRDSFQMGTWRSAWEVSASDWPTVKVTTWNCPPPSQITSSASLIRYWSNKCPLSETCSPNWQMKKKKFRTFVHHFVHNLLLKKNQGKISRNKTTHHGKQCDSYM